MTSNMKSNQKININQKLSYLKIICIIKSKKNTFLNCIFTRKMYC